jgi:hypothetical protein
MKNKNYQSIIEEVTYRVVKKLNEINLVDEGTGFDTIFTELKKKLNDIGILPDNVIDVSKYKEHEIIDALKSIGDIYRKPMGGKLHFFNKKTSISVYLVQKDLTIGKGAIILGKSGVSKSIPGGKVYFGAPVEDARDKWKELALIRKLPEIIEELKANQKK